MARWDPVRSIRRPSDSVSGYEDRPEFIRCVDGRQTQIHEVWTFGDDGFTREVHPTEQEDVGAGFAEKFETDYLTPRWYRVPRFGRNSINGSVEWLGFPDFLRTDGPTWTENVLAPHPR